MPQQDAVILSNVQPGGGLQKFTKDLFDEMIKKGIKIEDLNHSEWA